MYSWFCRYSSVGCRVSGGQRAPYGQAFGPGDEITVFVDMTNNPGQMSYNVNGNHQGEAFAIPQPLDPSQASYT